MGVRTRMLLASTAAATALTVGAMQAAAGPSGGSVVQGTASIGSAGNTTTVNQTSDRAIIEWGSFNLLSNERVNFNQPTTSSITLNRVMGGGPSSIDGTINANGRVFIINRDGVVFGAGSRVDVNGLLASSTDISNANFASSAWTFNVAGNPSASIVNRGTITAADAGIVAFVAPNVRNSGVIRARLGKIALGAGDAFTLDFFGDQLIAFAAGGAPGSRTGGVIVDGTIDAEAGVIFLTATSAADFVNTIINVDADLVARSASLQGGKIILSGGPQSAVAIDSTLDARGSSGGSISVAGGTVSVGAAAQLLTAAQTGQADGGDIIVRSTTQTTFAGLASSTPGSAAGTGGDITIASDGVVFFSGVVNAGTPPRAGVISINGAPPPTGGGSGGSGGGSGGGGSGGGTGGGSGGAPAVIPGPSIRNGAADQLVEITRTPPPFSAPLGARERPGEAPAALLFGDTLIDDFGDRRLGDERSDEARLMCLHGVSPAACPSGNEGGGNP